MISPYLAIPIWFWTKHRYRIIYCWLYYKQYLPRSWHPAVGTEVWTARARVGALLWTETPLQGSWMGSAFLGGGFPPVSVVKMRCLSDWTTGDSARDFAYETWGDHGFLHVADATTLKTLRFSEKSEFLAQAKINESISGSGFRSFKPCPHWLKCKPKNGATSRGFKQESWESNGSSSSKCTILFGDSGRNRQRKPAKHLNTIGWSNFATIGVEYLIHLYVYGVFLK